MVDFNIFVVNIDWYDFIMSFVFMQSYNVFFSGGINQIKYFIGFGFIDQEGLLNEICNEFQWFNIRMWVDVILINWFIVGGNINGSYVIWYDGSNVVWFNVYYFVLIFFKIDMLNIVVFEF